MARILLVIILLSWVPARAWELEGYFGIRNVTYDDAHEADRLGFSYRAKVNWYGTQDHGLFMHLTTNYYTIGLGYGWRTHGTWYWEGGLGAAYGASGPQVLLLGGTGFRFAPDWTLNFPLIIGSGVSLMPYIGYSF